MKLSVDSARCQGHTVCYMVAPDLFKLSEIDGHASAAVDEVPEELLHVAQMAVEGCPEQAISLDENE
ncbi:ferredoxin [[Mycobacterium] burgundiense]|uniref:Ferredoxin n=1 Tax=[Mycobacterium] burgundiense TaxID=3064286 RepID=A0ABM9LKL8_9MYCO|nr:ferredoxin [Mycolicibacterium sp. MU0053]CAJ1500538.1 ferredoxin [Mycolicibacterium sp. MU0053]